MTLYGPEFTEWDRHYRELERAKEPPVPGNVWTNTIGGVSYKFCKSQFDKFGSWYSLAANDEKQIIEYFLSKLKRDDCLNRTSSDSTVWSEAPTFVDCGAAYGSYTLPALAKGAEVIAFEPHPEYMKALQRNTSVNAFVCQLAQCGLFNEEKILDWDEVKQMVLAPLDSFPVTKIDWIKIDTEGAELKVLEGGINTLKRTKPNFIIEIHDFLDQNMETNVLAWLYDNLGKFRDMKIYMTNPRFHHIIVEYT